MRLLLLVLFPLLACQSPQDQTGDSFVKLIDSDQLVELLKNENLQLIDIRTDPEIAKGMIGHAKQIDYSSQTFLKEFEKLNKDEPIVIYCAVGGRSARAAIALQKAGFSQVFDLRGGIQDWQARGLPIRRN